MINGVEEYEVEAIIDSRLSQGKLQYLVKWKGYPNEEMTWEAEENLGNARDAVEDFHKRRPAAPRRIRASLTFIPLVNYTETTGAVHDWTKGRSRGRDP